MSDTPRTDQQAREWDDGFSMPSDLIALARNLERENAALRAELLEEARVNGMGGEREAKLLAEVAALRERLEQIVKERDEQGWSDFIGIKVFQIENIALRKDRDRLDWLERRTVSRLQAVLDHVELHKLPLREAIDLSIKEIGQ